MDGLPDGDLILRPSWPLPDFAARRISYGVPLMMVPGAAVIFAMTLWVSSGMAGGFPTGVYVALAGFALAAWTAYGYDGITIIANRDRVVVMRWFRPATIMPVADLATLTRSTVETRTRRRTIDDRKVSFITNEGQCALTVDWEKFTDDDLDQLSKVTGVRQDGGWFYKNVVA